jgi:GTP cyclohydrolase II
VFAYIDPQIREHLVATERLLRIDASGHRIGVDTVSTETDLTLNVLGPIPLPVHLLDPPVTFQWWAFVRHTELAEAEEIAAVVRSRGDRRLVPLLSTHMSVNSALIYGDLAATENPLVRVHSSCLTGDVFGSQRCECGPQLQAALARIVSDPAGAGALVYMAGHEGRGIGLWAKAITYLLQDAGQDTYQANRSLGLPDDSRDFSDAAAMLLFLLGSDRALRLLTNNPKKAHDLTTRGLTQIEPVKHVVGVNDHNLRYLKAKRRWGHRITEVDIDAVVKDRLGEA